MARAATTKGSGRKPKAAPRPRPTKEGFEIDGQFHEFPDDYTLGESEGVCEIWGVESMIDIDENLEVLGNPTHVRALVFVMLRRSARAGRLACPVCKGKQATNGHACFACGGSGLQRDFTVRDSEDITWGRINPVLTPPETSANGSVDELPPAEGSGPEQEPEPAAVSTSAPSSSPTSSEDSSTE